MILLLDNSVQTEDFEAICVRLVIRVLREAFDKPSKSDEDGALISEGDSRNTEELTSKHSEDSKILGSADKPSANSE